MRSPDLLSALSSRLLIVDMQTKLLPAIRDGERVLARCVQLVRGAEILKVPVSATEQYPKGLGLTAPDLAELIPNRPEKLRFSCHECLDWAATDQAAVTRHQIVVAGIETHVCVLQTALDLLAAGFEVFVVVDAVGSRNQLDVETAIQRLADSGAHLVTAEMVLFEWCEVAGTAEFKQISKLVTGRV